MLNEMEKGNEKKIADSGTYRVAMRKQPQSPPKMIINKCEYLQSAPKAS